MAKKEGEQMPTSKPNWRCRCRLSVTRNGKTVREYHVIDIVAKDASDAKLVAGRVAKEILPLAENAGIPDEYTPETIG
jgi:hypothetical protein